MALMFVEKDGRNCNESSSPWFIVGFFVNYSTGSPSAKQSAAQGARSPAPKVHTGTFLSSGVKVSWKSLNGVTLFNMKSYEQSLSTDLFLQL